MPAVSIEALSVRVAAHSLLDDVSVAFAANRITAIVGPTGCGKTTLLRSINRLHDHTVGMVVEGSVMIGDTAAYGAGTDVRELRRRVGMVFQRANPFPQSIEDNIAIAPRAHGLVKHGKDGVLVEEQLREVGLWNAVKDRLHRSPFTLSGGQQQLLCLARALALRPDVLMLDEPTSALDPASTEQIENLLVRLRKSMSLLIVTHSLAQALRIADDVVFLMAGRLVEASPAARFFRHARDERSRAYVSGRIG